MTIASKVVKNDKSNYHFAYLGQICDTLCTVAAFFDASIYINLRPHPHERQKSAIFFKSTLFSKKVALFLR